MNTFKNEAKGILERMPEACSWEQVRYRKQVREELEKAKADVEAGNGVPHEEAKEQIEEWLKSSGLAGP